MTDAEKLAELNKWARSFRSRCTQRYQPLGKT